MIEMTCKPNNTVVLQSHSINVFRVNIKFVRINSGKTEKRSNRFFYLDKK